MSGVRSDAFIPPKKKEGFEDSVVGHWRGIVHSHFCGTQQTHLNRLLRSHSFTNIHSTSTYCIPTVCRSGNNTVSPLCIHRVCTEYSREKVDDDKVLGRKIKVRKRECQGCNFQQACPREAGIEWHFHFCKNFSMESGLICIYLGLLKSPVGKPTEKLIILSLSAWTMGDFFSFLCMHFLNVL